MGAWAAKRVEVVAGKRAKVDIDATPGPLTLTVSVKGADGQPASAQVLVIEASVDVSSLEELRDGAGIPFSDKVVPIYIRGAMGGPVEIAGVRPGAHTACAMDIAGMMGGGDPTHAPFKCTKITLDAATPKRSVELVLPKAKP